MEEILLNDENIIDGWQADTVVYEDQEEQLLEVPEEELQEDPEEELHVDPIEEELQEDPVNDEVISILKSIDEKIGDQNVRDNLQDPVVVSDDSITGELLRSDAVVDPDIISKPLNEYTVSESILLMIFLCLFIAGIVTMIKRSIFKWS